jgi:hypothetical protein
MGTGRRLTDLRGLAGDHFLPGQWCASSNQPLNLSSQLHQVSVPQKWEEDAHFRLAFEGEGDPVLHDPFADLHGSGLARLV